METKKYFVYSVFYIAFIWLVTFSITSQSYEFTLFKYSLDLHIATWFVLPVVVLMLLSLIHISYYGIRNFFDSRAVKNDMNLFNSLAREVFLGLESNKEFKTQLFKVPSEALKALSVWQKYEPNFKDENLKSAYEVSCKVLAGEVCELKKYKLIKSNPLFIRNEINKINADYKYAFTILDKKDSLPELIKLSREALIDKATWLELNKFDFDLQEDEILILLDRYTAGKNFEISSTDLFELLDKTEFSSCEYIKLAKKLKNAISPDKLISIFEKLKNKFSNATEAYLYVLYDLQMIDKLRETLLSENEKFPKFEALLFLKDNGKTANLSLFYK